MLLDRTTFKHNPLKSRNTGIAITDHFQLSMEGLTEQFDCFVFFPSNELELVQRELEEKLSRFANFNVRANNRTRLETQFDLAKLYERIELEGDSFCDEDLNLCVVGLGKGGELNSIIAKRERPKSGFCEL